MCGKTAGDFDRIQGERGNVMERLTDKAWRNFDPWECCGQDKCCQRGCYDPGGCTKGCIVPRLYARLGAYEDTGLMPDDVPALQKDWTDLCTTIGECGGLDRVKELAETDKNGRLVVLPCQSGEHVFALLDGKKYVSECEVKHAVLDGWRKVFAICPIGDLGAEYYAPFGAFGQTVFLTREEAEKALEAKKDE